MGYVVASAETSGLLGRTARQRSSLVDAISIDPRDAEKGRGEEFADLGRQFDRSEPELVPQEGTCFASRPVPHRLKSSLFPDTCHSCRLCLSPLVPPNREHSVGLRVGLRVGLMWAN
jgi:hypothetical protein